MGQAGVAFTDVGVLAGTSLPNVSEYDDQPLYPGTEYSSALNGERITNAIASAMDHDSNFDQLRRTRNHLDAEKDRLQLLLDLVTQIGPDVELGQLLRTAAATIRRVIQCDIVAIHLPDKESSHLRLFTLDSLEYAAVSAEDKSPLEGAESGEDVREAFRARNFRLNHEGTGYLLPLIRRNRTLGVLELDRCKQAFSQRDVDFIEQIANQLAVAIDNALAYAEIKQLKEQLSRGKAISERRDPKRAGL